jgi:hypothetical protein
MNKKIVTQKRDYLFIERVLNKIKLINNKIYTPIPAKVIQVKSVSLSVPTVKLGINNKTNKR